MATWQRVELYSPQYQFVSHQAHHLAFVGGIGSGKTVSGCARALAAGLGWIGTKQIRTPNLGIVTAPTYPMLRDATLRTFLEVGEVFVSDYNKSEARVTLANGSEVLFRSTEHPERLRGPSISWWYGDEAALYPAMVRKIMLGRLRQYGQRGHDWLTTTPKGRDWIWKLFVHEQRAGYEMIRARTADNPYLDRAFVADLEAEYTGDFARQELEGEFVAFEGLVYPEFDRERHIVTVRPETFAQVIAGVDWGFTNPGVMLVFGVDGDGRMWGLHEEYVRQRRIEEWARVAADLRDTYGVTRFVCDPSEPDYIRALKDAGCRAEGANNSVRPGIQAVKNRLVVRPDGLPRLLLAPGMVWTASEFEQYQWRTNPRGEGFADEPMKANDHAIDSLRYAVMAVDAGPRVTDVTTAANPFYG